MKTEKVYWTISEVAKMIGVNKSNIRFWEGEFEWLKPKKRNGKRKFTKEDIEILKSINLLVNELGMTLDGVRRSHAMGYFKELEEIVRNYYLNEITNETERL